MKQDMPHWCRSPWLTSREAAAYLRMGLDEYRPLRDGGAIPTYRRGKAILVHTSDLDAWMRSQPAGAKVPEALRSA